MKTFFLSCAPQVAECHSFKFIKLTKGNQGIGGNVSQPGTSCKQPTCRKGRWREEPPKNLQDLLKVGYFWEFGKFQGKYWCFRCGAQLSGA